MEKVYFIIKTRLSLMINHVEIYRLDCLYIVFIPAKFSPPVFYIHYSFLKIKLLPAKINSLKFRKFIW